MVEESLCDGRRKPCLTTALLEVLASNAVRGSIPSYSCPDQRGRDTQWLLSVLGLSLLGMLVLL